MKIFQENLDPDPDVLRTHNNAAAYGKHITMPFKASAAALPWRQEGLMEFMATLKAKQQF